MSNRTWILITDSYYIKLLYIAEDNRTIKTYREADFDNSSDITYNLITRYKQNNSDSDNLESPEYVLNFIASFLNDKVKENAFDELIVIAPDNVHVALQTIFPAQLLNAVKQKISGDYINLSLDKLQAIIFEN